MGKSLRSKVKQHHARVKRMKISAEVDSVRAKRANALIIRIQNGESVEEVSKKNAFLHPDDPEAEFPQYSPPVPMDMRQSAVPIQEYSYLRFCRKFPQVNKGPFFRMKDTDGAADSVNIPLGDGKRVDGSHVAPAPTYDVANYAPSKCLVHQKNKRHHLMNPGLKSTKSQEKAQRYSQQAKRLAKKTLKVR